MARRLVVIGILAAAGVVLPDRALAQTGGFADCTGPQVTGSDTIDDLSGCTAGLLFQGGTIPDGSFHTFVMMTRSPSVPDAARFYITSPGEQLAGFLDYEGSSQKYNPHGASIYVVSTDVHRDTLNQECQSSDGGLPISSCPTSYGRYFGVDVNRDGNFDDLGIVFFDGSLQPLNFRILYIPLNWTGSQAAFDAAAAQQTQLFAQSTPLGGCMGRVWAQTLDVATQNLTTFTCSNDDCMLYSVKSFLEDTGVRAVGWDLIVGLLPLGGSPCFPIVGCSNTVDTVWVQEDATPVLAHEIGHMYSLADEYCSEQAGGDPRCSGPSDPNVLQASLGCDPNPGNGCCSSCAGGYFVCCQGNAGAAGGGSRCIMSSAGAGSGLQSWCTACLNHLSGRDEFSCTGPATLPFMDVVAVDLSVTDSRVSLDGYVVGRGRPTRVHPLGDRYHITLESQGTVLLDEDFDLVAFDGQPSGRKYVAFKAPVFSGVQSPAPIALTVLDQGQLSFRGTLFGSPPTADAGPDQSQECTSPFGTLVTLDGSGSMDPDGDLLRYQWSAPGVEPPLEESPNPAGLFPLGTTAVALTVTDGVFTSDVSTVQIQIVDTTPPLVALNGLAAVTLECNESAYVELGAAVSDACDADPTLTISGDPVNVAVPGTYQVTYGAVDSSGNQAAEVTRTVRVIDTRPPVIAGVAATPSMLCPPNHQMIPVEVSVSVTDVCDANPSCSIQDVASNEPVDGLGDGDTAPDWQLLGPTGVALRAERSGTGNGRTYTITVVCTDASGNRASGTIGVPVPHNR